MKSKDAIARTIAQLMPEFEQHLPPVRKIWMSEDYRMGIFDAVAIAMAQWNKAVVMSEDEVPGSKGLEAC